MSYITRFSCPYGFTTAWCSSTNQLLAIQDTLGQFHSLVNASNYSASVVPVTGGPANTYYAIVSTSPPAGAQAPVGQSGVWTYVQVHQTVFQFQQLAYDEFTVRSTTNPGGFPVPITDLTPVGSTPPIDGANNQVGDASNFTRILTQFDFSLDAPLALRNDLTGLPSQPFSFTVTEGFTGFFLNGPNFAGGIGNSRTGAQAKWINDSNAYISLGNSRTLGGLVQSRNQTDTMNSSIVFTRYDTTNNATAGTQTSLLPVSLPYYYSLNSLGSGSTPVVTGVTGRKVLDASNTVIDVVFTSVTYSPLSTNVLVEGPSGTSTGTAVATSTGTQATSTGINTGTGTASSGPNIPLIVGLSVGGVVLLSIAAAAYRRRAALRAYLSRRF